MQSMELEGTFEVSDLCRQCEEIKRLYRKKVTVDKKICHDLDNILTKYPKSIWSGHGKLLRISKVWMRKITKPLFWVRRSHPKKG